MQVNISSKWVDTAVPENPNSSQMLAFTDLQSDLCGPRSQQIRTELMAYMNELEQALRKRINTRLRPQDYEICIAVASAAAAAQAVLAQQALPMPETAAPGPAF
jgi:hypothetical protein